MLPPSTMSIFSDLVRALDSVWRMDCAAAHQAGADVEALALSMWAMLAVIVATWLLSLVTRTYSWVDRIWSITPVVYVAIFALHGMMSTTTVTVHPRLLAMLALVTAWGTRLTYNFYRKGGYNWRDEDYRWRIVLRWSPNEVVWQLFNFGFIAVYQNVLLWLVTLPAYVVRRVVHSHARHAAVVPVWVDGALVAVSLLLIIGETVADQQQWNFHQRKHAATHSRSGRAIRRTSSVTRLLKSGTAASTNSLDLDLERGFLSTGLWRYSRHPNFFCEQSFWCVFYLYAYVSLGSMHSLPAAVGAVLYVLLFQGSTPLTEWITKGKYPRYVEYQRETSRLIPWFARVTATESVGGASSPAKKGTRRAKKE